MFVSVFCWIDVLGGCFLCFLRKKYGEGVFLDLCMLKIMNKYKFNDIKKRFMCWFIVIMLEVIIFEIGWGIGGGGGGELIYYKIIVY